MSVPVNPYFRPDCPVLVICGPTASGKTDTALLACEKLNGEIVSADSMQIYCGLDIGTAKASLAEQARIPHHLLDICDPGERFSVADYKTAATKAVRDIYERGKLPVICGGTGQYISAMIEGLTFSDTPTDLDLRRQLVEEAAEKGLPSLYSQLQALDPETAIRVAATDQKRIIRAMEVYRLTGKTMTQQNLDSRRNAPDFCFKAYCLSHDRAILYERINARVIRMFQSGLEEEVRALLDLNLPVDSTCFQAIGYKEVLPYLQGLTTLEQTIADIQQATRRYAKRQLTWFRKLPGLEWLENHDPFQNAKIIIENY